MHKNQYLHEKITTSTWGDDLGPHVCMRSSICRQAVKRWVQKARNGVLYLPSPLLSALKQLHLLCVFGANLSFWHVVLSRCSTAKGCSMVCGLQIVPCALKESQFTKCTCCVCIHRPQKCTHTLKILSASPAMCWSHQAAISGQMWGRSQHVSWSY